MKKLLTLLFLLGAVKAYGATIYVDKDTACPGAGTTGNPYCSIANAVAVVVAGDSIKIRDAASAYSENIQTNRSGTSGNFITVEPDTGHNPTIRNTANGAQCATFWIYDADYWKIQNLNFDATGQNTCLWGAILIHAPGRNVTGHQILNNTFKGWGNSSNNTLGMAAVVISGGALTESQGFWPQNILIQGNTFDTNRLNNIVLTHSRLITIKNNEVKSTKCGRETDNSVSQVGIKASFDSKDLVIENNSFHDFDARVNCTVSQSITATTAYYCDVRGHTTTFKNNAVYNFDQNGSPTDETNFVSGVFIEAGCDSHTITRNLFYNIRSAAIYSSHQSLNLAQPPNVYTNNTIYGGAYGFFLKEGVIQVKNNIVKNASTAAICHGCGSGSPSLLSVTYDYNLYDDGASQTKIGLWAGVGTLNLANWRTQCNCDANSATGDPLFISTTGGSENFALTATSPAINTGTALGIAFNGTAPDKGAFETVPFLSCTVEAAAANTVRVLFENNVSPPMRVTDATGMTITVAAGARIESAPVAVGSNRVDVTIDGAAVTGGQAVTFAYATTGNLADSVLIGNTSNQRVNAVAETACTNNVGGGGAATLIQADYRFHGLRGTEAAPIRKPYTGAANSTNIKAAPGGRFRIRFNVTCATGPCPQVTTVAQANLNGGGWVDVADTVGAIKIKYVGTDLLADVPLQGTITTAQIGANTPSCLINRTATSLPVLNLADTNATECEYVFELGSDLLTTDSIQLRMSNLQTYTATPTITGIAVASSR